MNPQSNMNNVINISGDDYKFHFGMRVFWYVSNSGEIEYDEVDGRIDSDYDAFLEMFILANKSALKKSKGKELDITTLEFAIDDNPALLEELQAAFANSKVIKKLQEQADEDSEKKKKG